MKTTTVSKRFVALLCCLAVCIALIATALGINLAGRAQAEDAEEDGIELLEEAPTGDIQIIEEEISAPSEDITGEEASQAGETAVTEETQTPAEEPASGEPGEAPVPEDSTEPEGSTGSENPAVPDDSIEPENLAEPEGAPEESGEPEDAEPAGSEESAEPDLTETVETGETVDAAEAEPEDIDAIAEEDDTNAIDADAEEEAISEDDYGIMLLANEIASGKFGADGDNLEWVLDDEGVLTILGTGAMEDWPEDYPGWYAYRDSMISVVIEDGVANIGDYAFFNCTALTSISISDSVTSIGEFTFSYCESLTNVEFPTSLDSIGDYAFSNCITLTGISIPEGVNSIGAGTFQHCENLTNVKLPTSLDSIGDRAFYDCTSLTDISIPEGVASIGEDAFSHCTSLESIELPSTLTTIGNYAFWYCTDLTGISIPYGVSSIGEGTFAYCESLASIVLPTSLTSIGVGAFYECIAMPGITIPEGVISIGEAAFYECTSLTDISIPDNVTSIGGFAFYGCYALTSISIPESVTSIGDYAFQYCPLNGDSMMDTTTVNAGAEVYSIEDGNTTQTTKTTSYTGHTLTLPESVTSVGAYAFANTSVDYFVIGSSLTSITGSAFASNSLEAIIFDNSSDQVTVENNDYASIADNTNNYVSLVYLDGENGFELSLTKEVIGYSGPDTFEFGITLTQQDGTPFSGELDVSRSDGTEDVVDFTDGEATVEIASGDTLTLLWVPENMEWSIVERTEAEETVISVNGSEVSDAEGTLTEDTAVTFVNYYKMEITFHIVWDDADNQDGIRPDSVLVQLLADDDVIDEQILSADNGWSTAWSDLTIYADGHEIEYIVTEDEFDGYEAYGDLTIKDGIHSLVITHTHTPEQFDATVIKVWDDADNQDGIRPDSIEVVLLADGDPTGDTLTLNEDNGWSGSFTDLAKYHNHGEEITYGIAEVTVPNYTTVITGDQDSGFTVTNTYDFAEIINPDSGNPDSGNPEPVPQTGQDSLPIAPLAVSGAAIVAADVALLAVRRRRTA